MHKSGCFKNGSKLYATMLQSTWNYNAFGSAMPTRTWSDPNSKYKYGFNGKEKDNDINVDGGSYDFGARIYDSRLGRWLACDPLSLKYPFVSSFSFVLNMPLQAIDPDGKRVYFIVTTNSSADISDAASTRKGEIESSCFFDPKVDHIYYIEITDLGKLKDKVKECVEDANKNGYGKTVELSTFSHASTDGPVGAEKCSSDPLSGVTGLKLDEDQLSPTGWKSIDFNFDPENSVAAFYGCNTDIFAQRFLYYSNVKFSVGLDGKAGGAYNYVGEIDRTEWNFNNADVYLVTVTNPIDTDPNGKDVDMVAPRNVYRSGDPCLMFENKKVTHTDPEGNVIEEKDQCAEINGNVSTVVVKSKDSNVSVPINGSN